MNLAKIRRAVNKIAPSVKVENYRGCVRLTGELDNWMDIYKCGKAAVCKGSLGVVNDIRLKGFHEEPKKPTLKDDALSGQNPMCLSSVAVLSVAPWQESFLASNSTFCLLKI